MTKIGIESEQQLVDTTKEKRPDPIESAMVDVMRHLKLDIKDPSLSKTPHRIAKMLREFTQWHDLETYLDAKFESDSRGLVAQSMIPFRGMCEHHFAPFHGHAHIGYIPNGKVIGLSKLTRLVQAAGTRRPTIQEDITNTLATLLSKGLEALGVIVLIEAEHTCMTVRGINAPGVKTITSAVKGMFRDSAASRDEFFRAIRR